MKICLVAREYPGQGHRGGIGTYTEKTGRALAELGHKVDVIAEAACSSDACTRVEQGVTVHRVSPPRAPRLRTLARARVVSRRIGALDRPPDIVQASEYGAEAIGVAMRRPPQTKLVTRLATPSFVIRGLDEHSTRGSRAPESFVDLLERRQTRYSDAIISISRSLAGLVGARWRLDPARVTVIKTGVDFARRYRDRASRLPTELAGRQYILFFGKLEERKGVHVLAQALPEVLSAHPLVEIVFAGRTLDYQGRPMDEWVRSCNSEHLERLHFLPNQAEPELHALLEHALAVVLPSLWEGLGNVALEALDMGKPTIATSGSGFSEVIEDGRSGLLVPPGDVASLGRAITSLLADEGLRHRLAKGAYDRARSFELMGVTEELVEFYETVLSGRPGGAGRFKGMRPGVAPSSASW